MYYIFAFRSRTNAVKFYEDMTYASYSATLIDTPQKIGIGCGLSVKVYDLSAAKRILSSGTFSSFHGIYVRDDRGGLRKS